MNIFDAHFHIIDFKFPVVPNQGYTPPAFVVNDYLQATSAFNLIGGAVVSGSFQAFDQTYLTHALAILGDNFYGVANIPIDVTQQELDALQRANVAAVRFNLKRGGSAGVADLNYLSDRLYQEYGWHTELYVDSTDLVELRPYLLKIPLFSIDHLGLSKQGLQELYYWVERGVRVKATGFGRVNFDPIPVMQQIYKINPGALMFGTDLPSTRAKTPFSGADIHLITQHFSATAQARIFHQNALDWYTHRTK